MNIKTKSISIGLTCMLVNVVHGDSMISRWIDSIKPTEDLSQTNPGISKVSNGLFYMYKLNKNIDNNQSIVVQPTIVQAIDDNDTSDLIHVDVVLERNIIDAHPKSAEPAESAAKQEKDLLYDTDQSPLKDPSVIAAWDRVKQAEYRLEKHREYMEQVRKARTRLSNAKQIKPEDQSKVSSD